MKIKGKVLLSVFVLLATFSAALFVFPPRAHAITVEVDSVLDTSDSTPGNSICNDGSGNCTLRAALEETNALAGSDIIEFNIPGSGVHTITPGAELEIGGQVTINGESQAGAACNTLVPASLPASNQPHELLIQINPSGATSGLILRDAGDNSVIRGLIIGGAVDGFTLDDASNVTLECNYIGTNSAGASLNANSGTSILVDDNSYNAIIQNNLIAGSTGNAGISAYTDVTIQNNLIGTDVTGTVVLGNDLSGIDTNAGPLINHNVIAGNNGAGISGGSATGITILGNYIGIGVDGTPVANGGHGIVLLASNYFEVGGVDTDERNVISANGQDGIFIHSYCGNTSTGGTIYNNFVGTNADGEVAEGYGNGGAGIEVREIVSSCESIYRHMIGGVEEGQPNIIAGNDNQGVLIHQEETNDVFSITVLRNSIYRNGAFGIDLAGNTGSAPTQNVGPNELNDFPITYPTSNANNYLNHPVINDASVNGEQLTVNYDFTAPGITENDPALLEEDLVGYRLEFYLNDSGTDGSYTGYTQGQTYLGAFIVDGTEDNASHTFDTAFETSGKYVTATATILWQDRGETDPCSFGARFDIGPPYNESTGCVM